MGWSGANAIFDPVARKMTELKVPGEVKTGVLAVLIHELQQGDWDTESESLEIFADDEAVVDAFRRNNVIIECDEGFTVRDEPHWCERERGPRGHADGRHQDYAGFTWPVAEQEA